MRIVGWPWFQTRREKNKRDQGEKKSVGLNAERGRAMKRLEEKILMRQAYADESGSSPVM